MNSRLLLLAAALACLHPAFGEETIEPIRPVPFRSVRVEDRFWAPWLKLNRAVIVPHVFRLSEETGVVANFDRAAGRLPGSTAGMANSDEVLYKAIEAASFLLEERPDPALDRYLDSLIAKIAAAQEPDGFLWTHRTVQMRHGSPEGKFTNLQADIPLYFFGHMYEAAVAHHRATGKRTLLDIAIRNADMVDSIFGPKKRRDVDGHPNVEQALFKLFEDTGETRYLNLSRFFIDERGRANGRKLQGAFSQDHAPIAQQREAVGQAPRATYLYSGVADVARHLGEPAWREALRYLWANVVERKLYITGGIGSRHDNEGFGPEYDLPNREAYTETCAAVSFSMWNHRMFLLEGDGKYIDVLERTLYNNFLAGTALTGEQFFYANPLESDGKWQFNAGYRNDSPGEYKDASATRKKWFFCACCPPNVARELAWIPTHFYAVQGSTVFVNFYVAGSAKIDDIEIRQQTSYPWDGEVRLSLKMAAPRRFPLKLRIPGWAVGQPVPGDLYRYDPVPAPPVRLTVNGRSVPARPQRGYVTLDREWRDGDRVGLELPMVVRTVRSHPHVAANRGKVAFERGPLVYCLEGIDNGGRALDLAIQPGPDIRARHETALLGGVTTLRGRATRSGNQVPFVAIPYYVWSNRGEGEMAVWIPTARVP